MWVSWLNDYHDLALKFLSYVGVHGGLPVKVEGERQTDHNNYLNYVKSTEFSNGKNEEVTEAYYRYLNKN